jgi:hypothetical protein
MVLDETQMLLMFNNMRNNGGDKSTSTDDIYHKLIVYFLETVCLLLVVRTMSKIIDQFNLSMGGLFRKIKKWFIRRTCIILQERIIVSSGYSCSLSEQMNAIGYYLYKNNIVDTVEITGDKDFILTECRKVKIMDDMFLDVVIEESKVEKKMLNESVVNIQKCITYYVYSYKMNYTQLEKKIANILNHYLLYTKSNNDGKIYHFILESADYRDGNEYGKNMIIDENNPNFGSFETFDNIFSEHKDKIIREITRLSDHEYFRRNGLKRKKGYLFYGTPGCGKTSFVMAIAHLTRRHIIEIPLSRIKTNIDFERVITSERIRGINITRDNCIILFDEIDVGLEAMKKREDHTQVLDDEDDDPPRRRRMVESRRKISTTDDNLSLDTILSRLDGIGNYNGMIFIATTNCIDKIDPAIYRHGRLDPYFFDYCRKSDIIQMIEKYYSVVLSDKEKDILPTKENKISPASLKKYMMEHDSKDELIKYIVSLKGSS